MRSLISAICTSVRPVSPGPSPNFATSSCLRSWVMLMRLVRLAGSRRCMHRRPGGCMHPPAGGRMRPPGTSTELARALHVEPHLLDQRVDGVESALAAQPADEVQPDRPAVEVAVEVEQI